MTRTNSLYLVIGALLVAVAALSVYVYQEETQPKGVELSIGRNGIALEEK